MYIISMVGRLWKYILLFFLFERLLFSEENWSTYTGSAGNYSKKILTIGMQFHFIHYQEKQSDKGLSVLVFLNETDSNDWYFKTLYEKLGSEVSLFEYKTNSLIFSNTSLYQTHRLQNYISAKKLVPQWPPFFPEIKEIQRELETGNFNNKYLLLTGEQSNLLLQTKVYEDYDRLILVSPNVNLSNLEPSLISSKKLLWVGDFYEKGKLADLKNKFGGEVLVYQRSSTGRHLLMRNMKTLDDILAWLKI